MWLQILYLKLLTACFPLGPCDLYKETGRAMSSIEKVDQPGLLGQSPCDQGPQGAGTWLPVTHPEEHPFQGQVLMVGRLQFC